MQARPATTEAAKESKTATIMTPTDLPVDRTQLEKLARWVPPKEMALLIEICERARSDPDLRRPALLLCLAYIDRVARMLDQDPIPTVTERIKEQLQRLRERHGL
jgi:hypothetical protein